jgi:DnaJ-class molecular chaperone
MQRPSSLYEMLRVKWTTSPTEIKTAYHPDAVQSDGQDFMEIHNAYATLSDPVDFMEIYFDLYHLFCFGCEFLLFAV